VTPPRAESTEEEILANVFARPPAVDVPKAAPPEPIPAPPEPEPVAALPGVGASVWTGTAAQAEEDFEWGLVDGIDFVVSRTTGRPYSGKWVILNDNGSRQGQLSLLNGRLHGEEIKLDDTGKVTARNRWVNGHQVEE